MEKIHIIYPVLAIVLLQFLSIIHLRFIFQKAVKSREVEYRFFRLYEGSSPEYLRLARQHYKNLFEIPILFHLLCVVLFIVDDVREFDLWIVWSFVISKYIHSYIRMTSNYVPNRAYSFYVSIILLLAAWISLAIRII